MLCPRCNAINKDTARQCRECGCRLAGVRATPEARAAEKKYLITGILAFIGLVLVAVMLIWSISCIACPDGCTGCGRNEYINENVEGDWDEVIDDVTPTDVSPTDVIPGDAIVAE